MNKEDMTKKQMIIDYVAINDGATYTQIIKFIFEHNHSGQTYNWRSNRGYWSGGFGRGCLMTSGRYDEYLTKIEGKYYAVREGKIVNYPWSGYSNMTCEGPNCC